MSHLKSKLCPDVGTSRKGACAAARKGGTSALTPIALHAEESESDPMCITPVTVKRERDEWIPEISHECSTATRIVPCGKCIECLQARQNGWSLRLAEEMKYSSSAAFITYTYENVPLSGNGLPTLDKRDYQLFMKRLRKMIGKQGIKYYTCGEYGSKTQRPHYHSICFNLPGNILDDSDVLNRTWGNGHVHIGAVTPASIAYVTKYCIKGTWSPMDPDHETGILDDRQPEFSLMSKNLGIGFLTPQMEKYLRAKGITYATLDGGIKTALPRYYKEKIYDRQERAMLAQENIQVYEALQEQRFRDVHHEIAWKKDQYRKIEKKLRTENSLI